MDIKDLMDQVKDLTSLQFERKLRELVRKNYRYRNLSSGNQDIVLDLVKKYKSYFKKGIGISRSNLVREGRKLYQNRLKLDLTKNDLEDIKEILQELRA